MVHTINCTHGLNWLFQQPSCAAFKAHKVVDSPRVFLNNNNKPSILSSGIGLYSGSAGFEPSDAVESGLFGSISATTSIFCGGTGGEGRGAKLNKLAKLHQRAK